MPSSRDASPDARVAALIDVENVGLEPLQWLFDEIATLGRVTVRRAYADWSSIGNQRDRVLGLGLEPVQQFHAARGKNSADLRLAIDAVDLLYSANIDIFVIVSADSDFLPLISRLRTAGKSVIAAGRRSAMSQSVVSSVDRFYDLDRVGDDAVRDDTVTDLVRRAIQSSMDDQGKVGGSKLHGTIQRLDPSFDYRSLGFANFTAFVESLPDLKVTRPRGPGDTTVEIAGPSIKVLAEEAIEVTPSKIHAAWAERAQTVGGTVPGSVAGKLAAVAMGGQVLKDTGYKSLNALIAAHDLLRMKWSQSRNTVKRIRD